MEVKIFKDDESTTVYQNLEMPDSIFKKYYIDGEAFTDREDLEAARNKLIAIKSCENWPEFVIKPKKIYPLYKTTFKAEFPFIKGETLAEYQKNHQFSLKQCADFFCELEKKILSYKRFVFPDIANANNIIMQPQDEDGKLDFTVIDPDDIQFKNYYSVKSSAFIAPIFSDPEETRGLKKCLYKNNKYNKQLDIRSMYALFYIIFNNTDWFYPLYVEKISMKEYYELLKKMEIPFDSRLHLNSILTLDDEEPNQPISEALLELVDDGYEFEVTGKDKLGYNYQLVRK